MDPRIAAGRGREVPVSEAELVLFLEASVRLGVPLALAAMGEAVTERAGVINIGLEGSMIAGALGGALGALAFGGGGVGALAGAAAGALVALLFAAFALGLGADQIITGTAVTLGGLGFTGAVYQARFGTTGTEPVAFTIDAAPSAAFNASNRIPFWSPCVERLIVARRPSPIATAATSSKRYS